jgi:DNA-binding SARP family transcriptional activator
MEFGILGPLEVVSEGEAIALGGPKQRAVLANLIVRANQIVPTDVLIDEIWGDEPPDAALTTLRGYVSHLRTTSSGPRMPNSMCARYGTRTRK